MKSTKNVMVSGCFDLFHSGHVKFLTDASQYGDVFVGVGSDETIISLKNVIPTFNQEERCFLVSKVQGVKKAFVSSGKGVLDFEEEMKEICPDFFVVNEDGHDISKQSLCESLGVEYVVLQRVQEKGLPNRNSTSLRGSKFLPYRLCLAGGWIDQPFVNKYASGSIVVAQIAPCDHFWTRSGLGTSTRKVWEKLYDSGLRMNASPLSKLLFNQENGEAFATKKGYISGSQDAIGLTHPGVNRLDYNNGFWPYHMESDISKETAKWLSDHLVLVPLFQREEGYDPLSVIQATTDAAHKLGKSGRICYNAIANRDLQSLGKSLTLSYSAAKDILPFSTNVVIDDILEKHRRHGTGVTISGCGGGYMIVATDKEIENGFRVKIAHEVKNDFRPKSS